MVNFLEGIKHYKIELRRLPTLNLRIVEGIPFTRKPIPEMQDLSIDYL